MKDRSPTGRRRTGWRLRTPLLVGGTLLVLCAEFALLMWVYGLDDGVQAQVADHARVEGVVATLEPGTDAGPLATSVAALVDGGAPGADDVAAAAVRWEDSRSEADLRALVEADRVTGDAVASDARLRTLEVAAILAALLLTVSVGWFVWFRRLVQRHRDIQAVLTQQQMSSDGERRLHALVDHSTDVVAILRPDSTIDFVSPAVEQALGRSAEGVTGRPYLELVDDRDQELLARQLERRHPGDQPVTMRARHADGRTLVLEGTLCNLADDPVVGGFVLTVRDVTEQHRLREELVHQAFHDSLTGLANRQLFGDRLSHALLVDPHASTRALSVLFLDLDDFKDVNDSLGHGVGDTLLTIVAQRLTGALDGRDTAARLGGDEFAILLEGSDVRSATATAERILSALHAPVVLGDGVYQVRASVGIAPATPGETSEDEAMRNADVAMYMAKERGKGGLAVYDPSWHQRSLDSLDLRNDLQWAIEADELVLHYQPTVDLRTQVVHGFEALVRWQHPERGLLMPGDFIEVAEQTQMIVDLGRWVLGRACLDTVTMRATAPDLSVAVNVSVQQLGRREFVDEVVQAFTVAGLPPEALVLEITESSLLEDLETSLDALHRLRALGVRVAIDDFGTGYSSLSQLSRLPVDVLKVDKSFVDGIGTAPREDALVDAVLAMSGSLGLTTVAEGVEDEHQVRWLQGRACSLGQGFVWSPPVDLPAACALLRDGVPVVGSALAAPVRLVGRTAGA